MTCREAQSQLFAERDGALDQNRRAALDGHLAECGDCKRIRENLTAALAAWCTGASHATVPNAEREWHAVRRRIRGGDEAGATRASRSRRNLFAWLAVPLGAAAAFAVAMLVMKPASAPNEPVTHIAEANIVEVAGDYASTVVFVDDKSGWLFVWASDPNPKRG
ncbi:MAG: zf-HC2 domain-containing protein [Opitutaceae bacterium]